MTFHYSASSQPANHFIRLDRVISGRGPQEWWVRVDTIVQVEELHHPDYKARVMIAYHNDIYTYEVTQTCQQIMALIAGTSIAGEEDDN